MLFDFSSIAATIFIASISAAGLVYTAGTVIIRSVSTAIQKIEYMFLTKDSGNLPKNIGDLSVHNMIKVQKEITTQITVNVMIFLTCNLLIMLYWIIKNDLLLNMAVGLYGIGILLMMFIVVSSPRLWGLITIIKAPDLDGIIERYNFPPP